MPRTRFLEHGTVEWDAMWQQAREVLQQLGCDSEAHFLALLYRGSWDGQHHFTMDRGLSPDRRVEQFSLPLESVVSV